MDTSTQRSQSRELEPISSISSGGMMNAAAGDSLIAAAEVEQLRLAVFQNEEERRQLQQALTEQQELIEWQASQLHEERAKVRVEQRRVQELEAQIAALSAPVQTDCSENHPAVLNESRISSGLGSPQAGADRSTSRADSTGADRDKSMILNRSGVCEVTHSLQDLQQDVHQLARRLVEAESHGRELQERLDAVTAECTEWKDKYGTILREQTMSPGEISQKSQWTEQAARLLELEGQLGDMQRQTDSLQHQLGTVLAERDELQGTADIRQAQLDTLRAQKDKALAEVRSLQERMMSAATPVTASAPLASNVTAPTQLVEQRQDMIMEDLQGQLRAKQAEIQSLQQSVSAAHAALRAGDVVRQQAVTSASHASEAQIEALKQEAQQAQMRAEIYQQEARRAGRRAAELELELQTMKAAEGRMASLTDPLVSSLQAEVSSLRQRLVDLRHESLTGSPGTPGEKAQSFVDTNKQQLTRSVEEQTHTEYLVSQLHAGKKREADLAAKLQEVQTQLEEQLAAIRADAEAESRHALRLEKDNSALRAQMSEAESRVRSEHEQVVALRAQVEVLTRVLTPSRGQPHSRTDGDPSVSRASGVFRSSPVPRHPSPAHPVPAVEAAPHAASMDEGADSSVDTSDPIERVRVAVSTQRPVPVAKARFHAHRQLALSQASGAAGNGQGAAFERQKEAIHAALAAASNGVYNSSLRRALAEQVGRSRARSAKHSSSPATGTRALPDRSPKAATPPTHPSTGRMHLAGRLMAPIEGWYQDARNSDHSVDSAL